MQRYKTNKYIKSREKYIFSEKKKINQTGITLVALVVTTLFSYDENLKFSNSKGFLLATI